MAYVRSQVACSPECKKRHDRNTSVFRVYGLTVDEYDNLLERQGYVCKICKNPETTTLGRDKPSRLSVDHDHVTGQIRGLLCMKCNSRIGWLENNLESILDHLGLYSPTAEAHALRA